LPQIAQQQPAWAYRCQAIIPQAVIATDEVLHAVGLGQKFPAAEGVNVDLGRSGLMAADEMARQTNPATGSRKRRPIKMYNRQRLIGLPVRRSSTRFK